MSQKNVIYKYGTGNPVEPNGSGDVRDGIDNLQSFDVFINAQEDTYNQRDGEIVKTVNGMNNEFNGMISGMNSEFDAQLLGMGYTRIGTFSTGGTLTNPRQTLLWEISAGGDGQEYGWSGTFTKVVPPNSTPSSTGGISVGAWISRFDTITRVQSRENTRRSYANANYLMVAGSFELGGTLASSNDVLLHEASGKAYSGNGPFPQTVPANTDPLSGGFTDRSGVLSLNRVYGAQNGIWDYSAAVGYTITSTIPVQYCNISGKNFGSPGVGGGVDLFNATGDFAKILDLDMAGSGTNRGVFSAGSVRWATMENVTLRNFDKAIDINSLQYSICKNLRLYGNNTAINFGGTTSSWSGALSFYHTHISASNGVGIDITTPDTTAIVFTDTVIEGTNKAIKSKGAVTFNGLYVGDQNNTRPEAPSAIDSDGARITIKDSTLGISSFQTNNRKTVFDIKNNGRIILNDSTVSLATQRNSSFQFFPMDLVSFDGTDCALELNNVTFKRSVNAVHSIAPFKLTPTTILQSRKNIKNYVIDGTFQPNGYIAALTTGNLLPVNLGFVNQFGGGAVKLTAFSYDFTYNIPAALVGKKMCLEVWYLKGVNNNGRYVDFANSDFVEKPANSNFNGMGSGFEVDQPTPQKYIVTPTMTTGSIRIFTNNFGTPPLSEVYMTSIILKRRAFEDCLDFVEDVKSVLV